MEDENNLKNKVEQWLTKQGYPLEMKVASKFKKNDFWVNQSTSYKDPETGTSREIDIIASKSVYDDSIFAKIDFVIECKSSKNKPWIIFVDDNRITDYEYSDWYISTTLGWKYLLHSAVENELELFELNYHRRSKIGYSATQAFTSGEDITFKALNSAVKCALAHQELAESNKYFNRLEIIIPVIVIEGELFEASFEHNSLSLSNVAESVLKWDVFIGDKSQFAVHIVTQKGLNEFFSKATNTVNAVCADWKENLISILDE